MSNSKGNMILSTIMSVATLLVAVVGATFAYFSAMMNGKEATATIEVTSGTLSTEFNGDKRLAGGFVNQGETIATKEFTITGIVTGSNNLNYEATLAVNSNSYKDGELVYTITSTNESNNGSTIQNTSDPVAIPTGSNTIVLGSGVFAGPTTAGLSHKYIITIYRAQTADQDTNKTIDANIYVRQSKK